MGAITGVTVERLTRRFRGVTAISNVTTSFERGTIYAVLGANGAGKSTLLAVLAGWLPVHEGRILFDDSPLLPTATHVRKKVMLLAAATRATSPSQRQSSGGIRTLSRNLHDYGITHDGLEDSVLHWLQRLELLRVYDQRTHEMSRGQAYKFDMIGLFLISPSVWMLDEPFSQGLDAGGLAILEKQIRQHAAGGGIVIFSSQWPQHAKRLADRVVILDHGELMHTGAPYEKPTSSLLSRSPAGLAAVLEGLGGNA